MVPWASSQRPTTASASRAPFSREAAAARSRSQEKPWSCSASAPVAPTAAKSRSASGSVVAADGEPAGEQGVAALAVALDMVARDRDQLQRLARAA